MNDHRAILTTRLKLRLVWIAVAGLAVAAVAVITLVMTGPITLNLAFAVAIGAFFTFMLGGGLFALSFYSERTGFDSEAAAPGQSTQPDHLN